MRRWLRRLREWIDRPPFQVMAMFGEQDALPELDEFIRVNMPILWGQSGA